MPRVSSTGGGKTNKGGHKQTSYGVNYSGHKWHKEYRKDAEMLRQEGEKIVKEVEKYQRKAGMYE